MLKAGDVAPDVLDVAGWVRAVKKGLLKKTDARTREAWQKFFEADSERERDRFAVVDAYERNDDQRRDYRNGYYERDFRDCVRDAAITYRAQARAKLQTLKCQHDY